MVGVGRQSTSEAITAWKTFRAIELSLVDCKQHYCCSLGGDEGGMVLYSKLEG